MPLCQWGNSPFTRPCSQHPCQWRVSVEELAESDTYSVPHSTWFNPNMGRRSCDDQYFDATAANTLQYLGVDFGTASSLEVGKRLSLLREYLSWRISFILSCL